MRFGVRSLFSRQVAGTQPSPEGFSVWLSPSPPRWDHIPLPDDGPHRLIRGDTDDEMIYAYAESDDLVELLTLFCRFHTPRRHETCFLLDRRCTILLGWTWWEGEVYWYGCKLLFDMLAIHNPVDAALWERRAMEDQVSRSRLELSEVVPRGFK